MVNNEMNIIRGFQDILPKEMEKRRVCEGQLIQIFQQWGYQEIETPTLEYYDILTKGLGPDLKRRMFKLLNADGEIIVLRPDMTTPIARVTATKLRSKKEHFHKFYYINNVFRRANNNTEDQQEFHQAGIELLGVSNQLADAEVIAAGINALLNTGLRNFYIDIGSAKFFNSVMEQLPLTADCKKELRKTIMNKDFVLLEKLLFRYHLSEHEQESILRLHHLRGDEDVIREAQKIFGEKNEIAKISLLEISNVYKYLKICGLEKYALIDLGIIRNFDYYTGIVFEGYTGNLGSSICGGGRYDKLCQKFGKDIPSTGLAIDIEKLIRALSIKTNFKKEEFNKQKYLIRYQNKLIKDAFKLAERLRKKGYIVELELEVNRPMGKAISYSRNKNIRYIIDIQSENLSRVCRFDLETNREEMVSYD